MADTDLAVELRLQVRTPCEIGESSFSIGYWPSPSGGLVLDFLDHSLGIDSLGSPEFGTSIEHWTPLLKIRQAIWNPSLYIGDLNLRLFAEAQVSDKKLGFEVGVDFLIETRFLFRLYATLGVRISLDEGFRPAIKLVLSDVRDLMQIHDKGT